MTVLTSARQPELVAADRRVATVGRSGQLALFLILALGLALRLFHVTAPFLDAHAWRQLDTAAMARNFYDGPFFPLDPRVDWGGRYGYLDVAQFTLTKPRRHE